MIFSPPLWGGRRAAARRGGHRSFVARGRRFRGRRAGPRRPFLPPGDGESRGLRPPGTSPKRTTGGPQTGGRPHPGGRATGGPRRGEVELGAGGARAQARPPTPRPGGRSQRPGHRHHGRAPPAGGCRPPVFGRPATRPDAGRPRAGSPAASHQPTPTAARAHGPGPDKAGLVAIGAGAAGPGQYRPGLHPTGRIPLCLPQRGKQRRRGESPEPGRRGGGPCARRPGGTGGGRYGQKQGPSLPVVGRRGGKKMPGGLPPRLDTTGRKKCGEDALSPPLAVIADTRYPPVRRSSPKRTRCRPVPYALAVRPPLGLRSCVP